MLSETEIERLFQDIYAPAETRKIVRAIRAHAPVRQVKSSSVNIVTYVASLKMRREIATESKGAEFVAAILKEFDPKVLEYYPQPFKFKFSIKDPVTEEIHLVDHVPDFAQVEADCIRIQEWKTENKLQSLARRQPYRYQKLNGVWRSPLIEEYFSSIGMIYEIHSADEVHPNHISNLNTLFDYIRPESPACPKGVLERLKAALDVHGKLSLGDLQGMPFSFSPEHLNRALVEGVVSFDLTKALLSSPHEFLVFRDDAVMALYYAAERDCAPIPIDSFSMVLAKGAQFKMDNKILNFAAINLDEVILFEQGSIVSRGFPRNWFIDACTRGIIEYLGGGVHTNDIQSCLMHTKQELERAHQSYLIMQMPFDPSTSKISERTYYRNKQKVLSASANGLNEVLALAPNHHLKGFRGSKLSESQQQAMGHIFQTVYSSNRHPNARYAHGELVAYCSEEGITPPSYKTFNKFCKESTTCQTRRVRTGGRMAYEAQGFYHSLNYDTPVHGVRPFETVHIDHTLLDIELKCRGTNNTLGRPWLTVMVDAFSRRVMALHLGFHTPDASTVLMCFRDFVKRWKRMPYTVMCDNGKDLIATDVRHFVLRYGCHFRLRPKGRPRTGSVMERIFGSVNSGLIHNLHGNTLLTKHVRSLSSTHLPHNFAKWSLEDIYKVLEYWAYEYYDQQHHPALDISPREAFLKGLAETGERPHCLIPYSREFLILTCPSVSEGGMRTLDRQRGVKVHNFYYQSPELDSVPLHGKKFPVRYDPNDIGRVFVEISRGRWIEARAMALRSLPRMNLRQLKAVSAEYKKVHRSQSGRGEIPPSRLLRFMATTKFSEEFEKSFIQSGVTEKLQATNGLLVASTDLSVSTKVMGDAGLQSISLQMASGHSIGTVAASDKAERKRSKPKKVSHVNDALFGEME